MREKILLVGLLGVSCGRGTQSEPPHAQPVPVQSATSATSDPRAGSSPPDVVPHSPPPLAPDEVGHLLATILEANGTDRWADLPPAALADFEAVIERAKIQIGDQPITTEQLEAGAAQAARQLEYEAGLAAHPEWDSEEAAAQKEAIVGTDGVEVAE